MPLRVIPVRTIGSSALQLLQGDIPALLMGVAWRGIYILLATGWVVYLSTESYCGPLTLNVEGDLMLDVQTAEPVHIAAGEILFPGLGLAFSTRAAAVWQVPARPAQHAGARECKLALEHTLAAASPRRAGDEQSDDLAAALQAARLAVEQADAAALLAAAERLLGRGSGLTPAGDDVLLGLLLALRRWGDVLDLTWDMPTLSQQVVSLAYACTTTLSANLIECASRGEADERLLAALDMILTGEGSPAQVGANLAAWGRSSGWYVLQGMALVIRAVLC
ncbi:MAG: DUF2877 domain-containing protein [Anaerolineales bacterium]|nr:DUF2877 domain-containing protein [Anaerolineales bacterium]